MLLLLITFSFSTLAIYDRNAVVMRLFQLGSWRNAMYFFMSR